MNKLLFHAENNGVVTLTLNRPEIHNAFDAELVSCLTDTLLEIARSGSARAVVLTGAGASFSAGADLSWLQQMAAAGDQENEHDALALARMLRTLNYLPLPTIARVNGSAFGGGLGLIAACDIAIASDSATFGLSESRLGLAPAVISPYVFRRMGETEARRYFLTGEKFDARHARHIGLVHDLTPAAELDSAVAALVRALLEAGPEAVVECKQLVFHAAGHDAERQLQLDQWTARLIAKLRRSPEGQEGIRAFLEHRPPAWRRD